MCQLTHNEKSRQVQLHDFDSSSNFLSTPETSLTTTQGAISHYRHPSYSCKCRRGYSLFSDQFNDWKLQEENTDYSRSDIRRAYRLGKWY